MPSKKTHLGFDRLILGREFPLVHELKDLPSRWMPGERHRRIGQDEWSNLWLALTLYPNDALGAYTSGMLHDEIDRLFSKPHSPSSTTNSKKRRRRGTHINTEDGKERKRRYIRGAPAF